MEQRDWVSLRLLAVGMAIAAGLLISPAGVTWGEYHEPHVDKRPLRLSESVAYEQTFQPEFSHINGFLFQLEPQEGLDEGRGNLRVVIEQGERLVETLVPLAEVEPSGEVFVPLDPQAVNQDQPVTVRIVAEGVSQALGLRYQIDATKYKEGELFVVSRVDGERQEKPGDLAFRVRYESSAWERVGGSGALLLVGILLILGVWYWFLQLRDVTEPQEMQGNWRRVDRWVLVGVMVALGGLLLIHFGGQQWRHPTAQGDAMKNLLYLDATRKALEGGNWPQWHHVTCGGQPLAGNPEANTFGLGPLMSLLAGPVIGMKLLILAEVLILAAGMYALARYLGLGPLAALLPSLVVPLSGYVMNRILIGHDMFVGGLSFTPWILLTYLMSMQSRYWIVASGGLMALALYRGDTHSLFYILIVMVVWGVVMAVRRKSWRPIVLGVMAGVIFTLAGAAKIVPVLENTQHFNGDSLAKMVVLLTRHGLWDEVFLDNSIHTEYLVTEVSNAEWEDWENIGLYVGLIPLLLVIPGLIVAPPRLRWLLGSGLVVMLILGEGTVYNEYLRDLPYLGSLLRMPSRAFIGAVMLGSIAGGWALQELARFRWGKVIAAVLLGWAVVDVGAYAHQTLGRMEFVQVEPAAPEIVPLILEAHPFEEGRHPLTIADRNSVAPGSCQDFNVAPKFTVLDGEPLVVDSNGKGLSGRLMPNRIIIDPSGSSRVVARVAEAATMRIENGYQLPAVKEGLPVVVEDPAQPVIIHYQSLALPAGTVVVAAFGISVWLAVGRRGEQGSKGSKQGLGAQRGG